ncbi:DUF3558 domain-containing protein [Umezawaea sp. Da 62-37]|uniref:DUF3558 domain-containing protein n=1 Tax=Umezawaea sp. Da 62-37 TaxID=3075927 RepID=UPI0028F7237B|nr:DUF3558 domain-containing protein [Umezawaea sp. Da 62-37]WNV83083.1 DUF3558 domain-containing protein [Umezawaea sp. Da 62-37]
MSIVLVLAGCADKTTGIASRDFGAATTTTPVRPKNIDLNGKQHCLLAPTDWADVSIEKDGTLEDRTDDPQGVECAYNTNIGYFGFLFNITDGIGLWTDPRVAEKIDPVTPVLGYPAFQRAHGTNSGRCDIIVDVSEGQALDVFASIDHRSAPRLPPKCETARKLAELALTALNQ